MKVSYVAPTKVTISFQRALQLSVYNIKPEHFAQQLTYLDRSAEFPQLLLPRKVIIACFHCSSAKLLPHDNIAWTKESQAVFAGHVTERAPALWED